MPTDPIALWRDLIDGDPALRLAAGQVDPADVAGVARLRKLAGADAVRAALQLATARRKAQAKFGPLAQHVVADAEAVEQASSLAVGEHKGRRFRGAGYDRVIDACCGMGGDAIGFAQAGLTVAAIDRDPLRAWMCQRNLRAAGAIGHAAAADVASLDVGALADRALHLDPARRDERGRIFRLADYQPGVPILRRLIEQAGAAAVKLSPAVDLQDLEQSLPPGEVEFISEQGRLVQAVLWTGAAATASRSATVLEGGRRHHVAGDTDTPLPIGPMKKYLLAIDPAVERAGLMGQVAHEAGLAAVHRSLGLLTGDVVKPLPWGRWFELMDELPWRVGKVKQRLGELGGGVVEVKTRGKAVDTDAAQKQLRGEGDQVLTVFVLRWDERKVALITRRV